MNIHPIIVHFPIALLSLYVLFELIRPKKLLALRAWLYIKAVLLFFGTAGAFFAVITGDFGKSLYPLQRSLISAHENFAHITGLIFGVLTIIYAVVVINDFFGDRLSGSRYGWLWRSIVAKNTYFFTGPILVTFALLGFFLLLVTGALGGSVVYGANSDLFTQFVNGLFVH